MLQGPHKCEEDECPVKVTSRIFGKLRICKIISWNLMRFVHAGVHLLKPVVIMDIATCADNMDSTLGF